MLNKVQLIGSLGKDPEIRYTQSGTAIASFCMTTVDKHKDKSGQWKENTEWHNIVLWGKLAEIAGEYLAKGKQVYIEGKITTRKWQDKDGKDRYTTEITGEKMLMLGGKDKDKAATGGGGSTYKEPEFNPDDDIPFLAPPSVWGAI